jgi:hypothetical protein
MGQPQHWQVGCALVGPAATVCPFAVASSTIGGVGDVSGGVTARGYRSSRRTAASTVLCAGRPGMRGAGGLPSEPPPPVHLVVSRSASTLDNLGARNDHDVVAQSGRLGHAHSPVRPAQAD